MFQSACLGWRSLSSRECGNAVAVWPPRPPPGGKRGEWERAEPSRTSRQAELSRECGVTCTLQRSMLRHPLGDAPPILTVD